MNSIIAGRDTTAQALSWTMFRLLNNDPSLLAAVTEEIDRLGECTYESYRDFIQVQGRTLIHSVDGESRTDFFFISQLRLMKVFDYILLYQRIRGSHSETIRYQTDPRSTKESTSFGGASFFPPLL